LLHRFHGDGSFRSSTAALAIYLHPPAGREGECSVGVGVGVSAGVGRV
jgi:hypothetical protein